MQCTQSFLLPDLNLEQAMGFTDLGGGMAAQIFLYNPSETVLTTWDKSYAFEVAPGTTNQVGLSTLKFSDRTSFNDCVPEGELGLVICFYANFNLK